MLHAVISQQLATSPTWGQCFVILPHLENQIPNMMQKIKQNLTPFFAPLPCFVPKGSNLMQFCLFDPGFGHDAQMKTFGYPSYGQRKGKKIIKFGFCTSGRFKRYVTCIISQHWPNWVLYGQLFVTMSHVRYQLPNMMTDSCAESCGNSSDTHHDHVVAICRK